MAWHSDNEPLFGERGESKLIVSMSFGTRARFKWKGESCLDSEADSCLLDHGDLLVMDGQCQDEFPHCTDPGLEQERINVTFRWIKQHVAACPFLRTGVACCLPTCAQGSSVSRYGVGGKRRCLGTLGSPGGSTHLRCISFASLPSFVCGTYLGYAGVPFAGHALRAEFGEGIVCVVLWEFTR